MKVTNLESTFAVFIIYILTFPNFEPDYSIGLDSSYIWALNFLFHHDFKILKEIVYPFGPLALLKDPTTEASNFEFFLLFYSILKIWFSFLFIYLSKKANESFSVLTYIVLIIILLLFNVDYLIIGIVFIHCFLYLQNKKFLNIEFASSLAFVGVCIKSSIGVSAFSILFIAFLIDFFQNRNYKLSAKLIGLAVISILIPGIILFNSFEILFQYFIHSLKLSFGYSSALSLFPRNNWILLTFFISSILITPWILRDKKIKTAFLLLLPAMFAMWKHAMTREDFTHCTILLSFLFLFWGIIIAISKTKVKLIFLLAFFNISMFYSNMSLIWNYRPIKLEINGINNFENIVLNFKTFKEKFLAKSIENVQPNVLDSSILKLVNNSTIDSYPWELSWFSANNLNWKARRTLQSGSYSNWLDAINAQDFDRINGPEFIIFHYTKDNWNGDLGSLDGRYLLNDNPLTIYNIFNYYSINLKTAEFLLFKKNFRNNFKRVYHDKVQSVRWNRWIDVGNKNGEILRIKLHSKNTVLGKIKNFFYKSELYEIDYLFDDGKVLTYRFIPDNAVDGIWIHPFIRFPNSNGKEREVSKIRFRCSIAVFNTENIDYQFERIVLDSLQFPENDLKNSVNNLFLKTKANSDSILFQIVDNQNIINQFDSAANHSEQIDPKGFSKTLELNLDTLWNKIDKSISKILIESDFKYLNTRSEAMLVLALSHSENDFWKESNLAKNQEDTIWNYSYQCAEIERTKQSMGILKVYIWNSGKHKILIDDRRLTIKTTANN